MTAPWDPDGLWLKAKLFINHAMDDDAVRDFEERALWASLSLEVLAKAALARRSPLLIAAPDEDGRNLLAAAGLILGTPKFKSIKAASLFKRCAAAFRPFDLSEALLISENRNEYVHSATPSIAGIPESAWWPRFWAQARILIEACDEDVGSFVGSDRTAVVERWLDVNSRNLQERAEFLVRNAQQNLARFLAGQMLAAESRQWSRLRDRTAGLTYHVHTACPACDSEAGVLEGDDELDRDVHWERYSEDDYEPTIHLTIGTSHFSCDTCHLVLDNPELIGLVGLDETIEAEGDPEDLWDEPDYGND